MVKLDGSRVFKYVPPPDIGAICIRGICGGEEFVQGRYNATSHQRELVVLQPSIQTRNESAFHFHVRVGIYIILVITYQTMPSGIRVLSTRASTE